MNIEEEVMRAIHQIARSANVEQRNSAHANVCLLVREESLV